MTAPSENVSVKLNTTVYANVVFNKHNLHKASDTLSSSLHDDKSVRIRKKNGPKRYYGAFRIDRNVRLIAS